MDKDHLDKRGMVPSELACTSAYDCKAYPIIVMHLWRSVAQRGCFWKQFEQAVSCQPVTSTMPATHLETSPKVTLLAL